MKISFQYTKHRPDGTQTFQKGTWKWVRSGEQVEFTAWCKGQPDNGVDKNEHCLHLYGDPAGNCEFKWNDSHCIMYPLEDIMPKIKQIKHSWRK